MLKEDRNDIRAGQLIAKYGFDFDTIPKQEIIDLIEQEIQNFQTGSSEYIRLLCGYLFCIGDKTDIPLIEKAKYQINFDVGCMIDSEWIDSLNNGGLEDDMTRPRQELIQDFIQYYENF